MPTAEIIDPYADLRANRRQIISICIPVVSVAVVIGTIVWASWKNYEVAHTGTVALSKQLMESEQRYVAQKVTDYLAPASSSGMLAHDMLDSTSKQDNVTNFKLFTRSILRLSQQVDSFYLANQDGQLWIVSRDGENFKEIEILPNSEETKANYAKKTVTPEGQAITEVSKNNIPYTDPRKDNWYTNAVNGLFEEANSSSETVNRIHWTPPYWDAYTHHFLITASTAYADSLGHRKVFAINISLNELSDFINSLIVGKTGQAVIVDRSGKVIAGHNMIGLNNPDFDATDVFLNPVTQPVFTRALNIFRVNGAGAHIISAHKKNYIAISTGLPKTQRDWVLMLNAPENEFASFIQKTKEQSFYSSFIITLLAIFLSIALIYQGNKIRKYRKERSLNAAKEEKERTTLLKIATIPNLLDPDHDIPILTEILTGITGSSRAAIWRLLPDSKSLVCEDLFDSKQGVHAVGMELERELNQHLFQALEEGHSLSLDIGNVVDQTPGAEGLSRLAKQAGEDGTVVFYPVLNMHQAIGALTLTNPDHLAQGDLIISLISAIMSLRFSVSEARDTSHQKQVKLDLAVSGRDNTFKHLEGFLISPEKGEKDNEKVPHSGMYPDVPIMVLKLNRAYSSQHADDRDIIALVENLAKNIQEICKSLSVFALQVLGNRVVFLGDCSLVTDPLAITRLAEASLQIREKCLNILAQQNTKLSFSIGIDSSTALVSRFGEDPAVFNIWGESLATAELLADTAPGEGVIQVSDSAHQKLKDQYLFRPRGSFYQPDVGIATSYILAGRW
ncbi:adenylate/guanylate cyclase domain-containing protein [Acetobacteraceae bacterium]|nr:adenylate/guanylate cyclase domain-containing protein [Acetobacteraceae bacterium]